MTTALTVKKRERFIEALKQGSSVRAACDAAGLPRSTAYDWRGKDLDFAEEWGLAYDEGTDLLEDEALRRAMAGSDRLLIELLRARRPSRYSPRFQVDQTTEVQTTYVIDFNPPCPECGKKRELAENKCLAP